MAGGKLQLRLYGAFSCEWPDGNSLEIRGAKHRALIAILATAAKGTHSRSWLQETLWSLSGEEHGRASLRRALSDLRQLFGARFEKLFEITNIDICLRQSSIELVGDTRDGEFLEGLDIPEKGFRAWRAEKRSNSNRDMFSARTVDNINIAPSVAVVPFLVRDQNPNISHFSDLMVLEITRMLSRSKLINVISHLSSRQFSRGELDLGEIGSALNIDYLVYGTIGVDGGNYRIDTDFVEVKSGLIRWSRTFDSQIADVLSGQNDTVRDISNQIGREILLASIELANSQPLTQIDSHALLMSSVNYLHQHRLANFSRARTQLEELISREPKNSQLHAWLAKWYLLSIAQGWSTNVVNDTATASDCTSRALDINPNCSFSLAIDGMIESGGKKDPDIAASRFDEAIEIDPNNALAWLMYSRLHSFTGNGELSLKCAERACLLSPIDPHGYFFEIMKAGAHLTCSEYSEAAEYANKSITSCPRHTSSYRVLVIAYELMGMHRKAQDTVKTLMKLEPKLTVANYLQNHPAGDLHSGPKWANALESAGVPKT